MLKFDFLRNDDDYNRYASNNLTDSHSDIRLITSMINLRFRFRWIRYLITCCMVILIYRLITKNVSIQQASFVYDRK